MIKILLSCLVIFFLSSIALKAFSQYTYPCNGPYLHFDGKAGYVDAQDPLTINTGITLAAWVRCGIKNPKNMGLIYRQFFVVQGASTLTDWGLVISSTGQFMFVGDMDTTSGTPLPEYSTQPVMDSLSSGFTPDSGVFYHVAVMLDPTTFLCTFYINGSVVASKTMKGGLHWASDGQGNEYDASIGSSSLNYQGNYYVPYTNYTFFNGDMSDVFMEGAPISAKQLDSVSAGLNLVGSVFFYPLNEGSGSQVYNNPAVTYNSNNYGNVGTLSSTGTSWQNCVTGKAVANAGANMTITMPKADTILNGSASYTNVNGGSIVSYAWRQKSGPSQSVIANPNSAATSVSSLKIGSYSFELTVTDNIGDIDSASVQVNVQRAWANVRDSLALVDLYNNANGLNWTTAWSLTQPVMNWSGVIISLDSGRVTSLLLNNNNLAGGLPATISNLSDLTALNVSNNKLTFNGMELLAQKFGNFASYSPQDSIIIDTANGIFYAHAASGTLNNNTYNWYKNGLLDATNVGDLSYVPDGSGQYYVVVTNSVASQLTLYSKTINYNDTFPDINLIDPYPTSINDDGTLNSDVSKINFSSQLINGAVTDGLTKLLLVAQTKKGIQFSISANDGKLGSLSDANYVSSNPAMVTVQPDDNGYVMLVYTVPDGYGTSNPPGGRKITITASLQNEASETKNILITLLPPPVVLVHGMWGGPNDWKKGGFTNALASAGYKPAVGVGSYAPAVYLADYSLNSNETFDPNDPGSASGKGAIETQILQAESFYRSNKIAICQVDLVSVGLGGLMARSYSQDVNKLFLGTIRTSAGFTNRSNYFNGSYHKLITLGTPHRGTPMGPTLWNHQYDKCYFSYSASVAKFIYKLITFIRANPTLSLNDALDKLYGLYGDLKDVLNGPSTVGKVLAKDKTPIGPCHRDFQIGSSAYGNLTVPGSFYTYSVSGNSIASSSSTVGELLNEYDAKLDMNAFWLWVTSNSGFKTFDSIYLNPPMCTSIKVPANDLFIEVNSQTGGLSQTTNFGGTAAVESSQDTTYLTSSKVQAFVANLLLSDQPTLFSKGFPPQITDDCINGTYSIIKTNQSNKSSVLSIGNNSNIPLADSLATVQIASPVRGSVYQNNSNTSIHLQYLVQGPITPTVSFMDITGIGRYVIPNQPPYDTTIILPPNVSIGNHLSVLFVKDTTGLLFADTCNIIITPQGILDSIGVNPGSLYLDSAGRTAVAYVEGYYSDGSFSDISNSSAGTTYSSQKSGSIFTVDANGVLTAIKPGTDTLIVSNTVLSIKVGVIVDSNFVLRTIYPNSIDFPTINSQVLGSPPIYLIATSASGNEVNFSVTSGNAAIINGILLITAAGPVTVKASDPGNAYFAAAPDVYQTFCVSPGQVSAISGDSITCASQKTYSVSNIPGSKFKWQVSEGGTFSGTDSSISIRWLAPGKHSITVTPYADSCIGTPSTLSVIVNSVPKPLISPSGSIQICNGGNSLLQLSDSSGAIQWYKDFAIISSATSKSITVSQTGSYFAAVKDSAGCAAISDTAVVTLVNLVKPLITPSDSIKICEGSSKLLQVSDSSGRLQWYNNGIAIANATQKSITVSQAGNYFAKIIYGTDCNSTSDTAIVAFINLFKPSIIPSDSIKICEGASTLLQINDSSGALQWYQNGIAITNATLKSISVSLPGVFDVKATDSSGCNVISDSVIVNIDSLVAPLIVIADSPGRCADTLTLKSDFISGNQWYEDSSLIAGANAQYYAAFKSGNYTVQVTDAAGCTATSPVKKIKLAPMPDMPVITLFNEQLKSSADSGNQWFLNDTLIAGAINKNYTPNDSGTYTVQVTINGCSSPMSKAYLFVPVNTSGPIIQIFPNPASSKVTIVNRSTNSYTVQLFDICGNLAAGITHAKGTQQVNVLSLARGIYILLITDEVTRVQIREKILKL